MLAALADLNTFKANHGLSATDLLAIGDTNHDGAVTNADLQSLLNLLIGGGGSGATATETTANVSGPIAGSVSNAATVAASAKPMALVTTSSNAAIVTGHETSAPLKSTLQTPAAWTDVSQSNRLVPTAVDQTLRLTNVFRSRHLSWGPRSLAQTTPSEAMFRTDDLNRQSGQFVPALSMLQQRDIRNQIRC
jgi:hypothetical protein